LPPSTVTAYVPPTPLAHATRAFTALIAWRRLVVPLVCAVSTGARGAPCVAAARATGADAPSLSLRVAHAPSAATAANPAANPDRYIISCIQPPSRSM